MLLINDIGGNEMNTNYIRKIVIRTSLALAIFNIGINAYAETYAEKSYSISAETGQWNIVDKYGNSNSGHSQGDLMMTCEHAQGAADCANGWGWCSYNVDGGKRALNINDPVPGEPTGGTLAIYLGGTDPKNYPVFTCNLYIGVLSYGTTYNETPAATVTVSYPPGTTITNPRTSCNADTISDLKGGKVSCNNIVSIKKVNEDYIMTFNLSNQ